MSEASGAARAPKKLYYKIGEACKAVDVQPYVLRYWETEFSVLAPSKSKSGQRVYSGRELELIRRIKELLYDEGYTIAGAKKRLETEHKDGRDPTGPEDDSGDAEELEEEDVSSDDLGTVVVPAEAAEGAVDEDDVGNQRSAEPVSADVDTALLERVETLEAAVRKARREIRDLLALVESSAEEE